MIEVAATDSRVPHNAARLAGLALERGWAVHVTHAQWVTSGRDHESVAIRMAREGRLVAIWKDGRFDVGLCRSRKLTFRELRELVLRPAP